MTREQMQDFARAWIAAWNRRDLEAVLAHFTEEARFRSPKALALTGSADLQGKPALRAYWQAALGSIGEIRFVLDRVVADPAAREMVVLYEGHVDGRRTRAAEAMRFDAAGRQIEGEALYGAPL
ncbi:nuclear transport factor 2 family protein [Siccirubricoccus sp. G192]|uniref:nuclear transport factor 2 family protein n=1 Tax=Siccirubricoccus sp. G192 TaxID=2849651 RepID=UPI001C2C3B7B|nr:nuclear transport factor 2 family protein [Siccirubricoccus sp. G192]MBV1797901.1 nuclear transport factor 2 family protein [Siccirubricoccus sp. G192]